MCALHATHACHTVEVRPQATAEAEAATAAAAAATRAKVSRSAKPDNYFSCQHCAT